MRHEECGVLSRRETMRETTDVSENEDGAKVAPNMGQVAHTLGPQ